MILFKNADVLLRENDSFSVTENTYLGVKDGKISYIGKDMPAEKYDVVKDMSGKLLMPGLINCHNHCPMVLLRGVGSDLPLDKWLFDTVFPIEDKLTREDIINGTYLAAAEMLAAGTVSFSDMYFEPGATVEVIGDVGMKANITRPVQSFDPDERPEDSYRIKESIALYDKYNGSFDGRVLIDFCIHAEYTCTEAVARAYIDELNARNGNLHVHLSETKKEHVECITKYGKTPAVWFDDMGAFNSRAFAAHCVWVDDNDTDILKERGVSVVHNPTSNMKLGSGFAPVNKMLAKGINVALGTDGAASNNNLNMFEEMHLASLIHNGYKNDATLMDADTVLKLATVNGAALQGRPDCGEIKEGNRADIIAIDMNRPHLFPALDKKALITYSAQGSDVCMTMVDGKILYENGEYKTIDMEKTYFNVKKSIERLY